MIGPIKGSQNEKINYSNSSIIRFGSQPLNDCRILGSYVVAKVLLQFATFHGNVLLDSLHFARSISSWIIFV